MNELSTLEVQIQETRQAIALHQQALADSPSPSLAASLRSLQKRLERLEACVRIPPNGRNLSSQLDPQNRDAPVVLIDLNYLASERVLFPASRTSSRSALASHASASWFSADGSQVTV